MLEITDRITRILGQVNTGTANGSLVITDAVGGAPWFSSVHGLAMTEGQMTPDIWLVGNTLYWSWGNYPYTRIPATIIYGTY
ncbi:hypothetical protein [Pseudomonas sp.]|uniref:hypothetical protein n=1 Tax=Pseudomonas sp. TaxID=306 RepID=UPI0028A86558|nr:hypothetical protein [Pseudomonas sp.]